VEHNQKIAAEGPTPMFLHISLPSPRKVGTVPTEHFAQYSSVTDPARRAYLAAITSMDTMLGKVFNDLKQRTAIHNSLVLAFTSTSGASENFLWQRFRHGGSNGALKGEKYTWYEGGVKVPGFIYSKMMKAELIG